LYHCIFVLIEANQGTPQQILWLLISNKVSQSLSSEYAP